MSQCSLSQMQQRKVPKHGRDCDAQSIHVPPLPKVLVVLPPNMPPPVVLLFEPNALPVFEPKPEAKDELDRIPGEVLGADCVGAHCRRVRERQSLQNQEKDCYLPPEVLLFDPKPKPVDCWLLLEPKPPKPPPPPKDMLAVCEASRAR